LSILFCFADAAAYWRIIEEHGVNALFSAPTAFRAIRQLDPEGSMAQKYDLSSLKAIFVAGERSDPTTLRWIENILHEHNVPAIDHWWQTELAFPGAGKCVFAIMKELLCVYAMLTS